MIIFWIIFILALLLAVSMTSGTIYVNSKNSLEPMFSAGPTGPTGPAGSGNGTLSAAEVSYLGNGTVGPTFGTPTNTWINLLSQSTLSLTPSSTTKFDIFNDALRWKGPQGFVFNASTTLTASTNGPNDSYDISLFVNGSALVGSQMIMDFSRSDDGTTFSYNKLISLNPTQYVDVRMRRTTAAPDKDVTMYFAGLILTASTAL